MFDIGMFDIGMAAAASQRSEELSKGIDEFLARGGKIQVLDSSELYKDRFRLRNGRHQSVDRHNPSEKWFKRKI